MGSLERETRCWVMVLTMGTFPYVQVRGVSSEEAREAVSPQNKWRNNPYYKKIKQCKYYKM